jgi:hypothetical protein
MSGVHAEDAVKADQPTYADPSVVTGCEAYGSGFARLPGTSTCVRVSGSASFEQRVSGASGGDRRDPE